MLACLTAREQYIKLLKKVCYPRSSVRLPFTIQERALPAWCGDVGSVPVARPGAPAMAMNKVSWASVVKKTNLCYLAVSCV